MDNALIDRIKSENEGKRLFIHELTYNDEAEQEKTVEFVYRAPNMTDFEKFVRESKTNTTVANNNMFFSVIVSPNKDELVKELQNKPLLIAEFVNDKIARFFGSTVKSESRAL